MGLLVQLFLHVLFAITYHPLELRYNIRVFVYSGANSACDFLDP